MIDVLAVLNADPRVLTDPAREPCAGVPIA